LKRYEEYEEEGADETAGPQVAPQQPSHDDQLERASPQVVEEQHRLVKPARRKLFTLLKGRYRERIEFKSLKQYQLVKHTKRKRWSFKNFFILI
jgi:hypothetical protein